MQIDTATNALRPAQEAKSEFPVFLTAALAVLAVAIRLFFWFYTGRTWEDALITVLHSENAVNGLGLTHYRVGEPAIHGFTSPLSVLVPLLGDLVRPGLGLAFIKLVSALSSAAAVFFGIEISKRVGLSAPMIFLAGAFLAIEHHQLLWGMAGMETQMAVSILLFSIYSLMDRNPRLLGLSFALCVLVRPDFAIWVALAGIVFLYQCHKAGSYKPFLVAAGIAVAIYAPWILFTTLYYGSPVPNTILAKSLLHEPWWKQHLALREFIEQVYWRIATKLLVTLGPAFGGNGAVINTFADSGHIAGGMRVLMAIGLGFAFKRRDGRAFPLYAFLATYLFYYVFLVPVIFFWYSVPVAAVAVIVCAKGVDDLLSLVPANWRTRAGVIFAAAYLSSIAVILPTTFQGEKNVQRYIEDPIRKAMGLYLNQVMGHDETVGCEPLGYVSYYSRRTVYDYPGLCSRKVVNFLRTHPDDRRMDHMLEYFHPNYIVLRDFEFVQYSSEPRNAWLARDYTLVKEFRLDHAHARELLFGESNIDKAFLVFRRNR